MNKKLEGNEILIKGGAGFIGSHLAERVVKMGERSGIMVSC